MAAEVAVAQEEADRAGRDPGRDRRQCLLAAETKDRIKDNPTFLSGTKNIV